MQPTRSPRVDRLAALGRRRPVLWDGLGVAFVIVVAAARTASGFDEGVGGLAFAVALATPLLWRRRYPEAVFLGLAAVALLQWVLDVRSFGDAALLIALYTVAVTRPTRSMLAAVGVVEVGALMASLRWAQGDEIKVFIGLSGMAIAAAVMGTGTGQRRALLASLHERAARLEVERDQQGRLSAAAERSRIAREMHDIVAHNLSVMIALADGAEYALEDHPEEARTAIRRASSTGRHALTEMRRLLGVLRDDDEHRPQMVPQPGLDELDGLVERVRATGLPVSYEVAGRPGTAPPAGLQLAVYRIVQEALTNTLKHAGRDATAQVRLRYGAEDLVVEVVDTGDGSSVAGADGGGLRGMRERAAVYDGALDAGPAETGGWRIRARLPVARADVAPTAA